MPISQLSPEMLSHLAKQQQDLLLIDVREIDEYNQEHIPSSINIPLSKFAKELDDLIINFNLNNKKLVFYCRSGVRSMTAGNILLDYFDDLNCTVYNLQGGIINWKKSGFQVTA